jgi:hypothetical protein
MARFVVLGLGEDFVTRPNRNGEIVKGVEMFALSLDAPVAERGFQVFKISRESQHLFPRLCSVYDVTLAESYGQWGPRTTYSDAVYLGPWDPVEGCGLVAPRG